METKNNSAAGFTLLETILYTAIVSVVVFSIAMVLTMFLQVKEKNTTLSDVKEEGVWLMQRIVSIIENAENIQSPIVGTGGASLTLDVYDTLADPSILQLTNGVLTLREGTGVAISLNSPRVVVSNLTFMNVSRPDTPGIVKFQFTMTHSGDVNNFVYGTTENFYGSASLR